MVKASLEKVNFANGTILFDVTSKCDCGADIYITDIDYNDINKAGYIRCLDCKHDISIDFGNVKPLIDNYISANKGKKHAFLLTNDEGITVFTYQIGKDRKEVEKSLKNNLNSSWHIVKDEKVILEKAEKEIENINAVLRFAKSESRDELKSDLKALIEFKKSLNNKKKTLKKIVATFSALVLSASLLSACGKDKQEAVKIDREQFKIVKYDKKEGTYVGKNVKSGTDKDELFFTVDDIEGSKKVHVGNIVNAFYAKRSGEDSFIFVKKQ